MQNFNKRKTSLTSLL